MFNIDNACHHAEHKHANLQSRVLASDVSKTTALRVNDSKTGLSLVLHDIEGIHQKMLQHCFWNQ